MMPKGIYKRKSDTKLYRCRAYLFCMYELLELSSPQIAKECKVIPIIIRRWLKKFNIRIRTKSEMRRGKKNPMFKGNDIKNLSVDLIHKRIEKVKSKSEDDKCAICNQVADKKGITKLVLSNIKGHNYTLNPDDYQWAHHSCHSSDDWTPERRKKFSENHPMKRYKVVEKSNKTSQVSYWLNSILPNKIKKYSKRISKKVKK